MSTTFLLAVIEASISESKGEVFLKALAGEGKPLADHRLKAYTLRSLRL